MSVITQTAENLHANLYGKKKEDIILDAVTSNNLQNRVAIAQYYRTNYGTSLFDDIKSKISNDFGYCAAQMFLSPLEFCIYHLKLGIKNKNECTMEMLTSKTTEELRIIADTYKKDTGKDLKKDIQDAYKGAIGKNLLNLFTTPRKANPRPDKKECQKYANKLSENKKGPNDWVEDENLFKEIFIERSPEELILIARYYLKITGTNLIDAIEKNAKGQNKNLLKEILYNNIMPHELYAEKIYLAIKGLGTNEEILSRALVSRCELDMAAMRDMYLTKYKVTMKEDIIDDTSDFYQQLCVYLSEK
jgi:hypothetical protein